MKLKTHLSLLIAVVGILSLSSCRVSAPQTYTAGNVLCSNYAAEPPSTLQVALVHSMTKGYRDHQLSYIVPNMKKKRDAHSIWFDLVTLKKFLYHLEMKTKANDPTDTITDADLGVRIYYANYPEKATWGTTYKDLTPFVSNPNTKGYEELHTLVMIPTIRRNGLDTDFNPMDPTTLSTGMVENPLYDATSTGTTFGISGIPSGSRGSSGGSTGAQNHGSLIPPGLSGGENFGD